MEYKLTVKENFLRLMSGQMPEYVPKFEMMGWMIRPSVKFGNGYETENGGFVDELGVEYAPVLSNPELPPMPAPGKILLEDVADWEKIIRTPEIPDVDWAEAAKKDLADYDRVNKPLMMAAGSYFQTLMSFMGFTGGLLAMYEDPDSVYDLFTYLSEYDLKKEKIFLEYYKPDIWYILDDNATKLNPFISPEMNRRLVIPFQRKQCELALNAGCKVLMHDCGRCEDFIDDWIDMGISGWDPAQVENDLVGIKAKYGRKLAIIGGWDSQGPASWASSPDELTLEAAKECVDKLAPGGGFAWTAHASSDGDVEGRERKNAKLQEFYEEYVKPWYYNH
ncbi:MAG: hypothetical protein IKK00_07705 [Oscillospiraceae bacterium]|nr:hypothetical protein [Oscillospiraceae bacterium]MBR4057994.1 hypothetical protein [Oscillospiraceae bacterium]MBR6561947.1 hypothetical protein [Oscillospiraceae bacterium]